MDVIEKRRSYYSLGNKIGLSQKELMVLLRKILYYSPSLYNIQSSKVIILTKKAHKLFWSTVVKEYFRKSNATDEVKDFQEAIINREIKAYGTILFFEDEKIIENFVSKKEYTLEEIKTFSLSSVNMLIMNVWNELRKVDIGAHLNHYKVGEETKLIYSLPKMLNLSAIMTIGSIEKEEAIKVVEGIDERIRVIE